MRWGIRAKLIVALSLAAVLPLVLGLISIFWLGHRHQLRQQGRLYETMAVHLAGSLGQVVDAQIGKLDDWLSLSELTTALRPVRATALGPDEVRELDRRWPDLGPDDDAVRAVLDNPVAERLRDFQAVNRLFSELIVTDAKGRLLAASNKTTDYWQADEDWWIAAAAMNADQVWVEGIHLDASAGVLSLDIALPIHGRNGAGGLLGVVKGVLNASPLLASLRPAQPDLTARSDVILPDGRILAPLFRAGPAGEPLHGDLLQHLRARQSGWAVARAASGHDEIEGFAPIFPGGRSAGPRRLDISGFRPLFVVVHEEVARVLAPVHAELRRLALGGALLLLVFALGGFVIADRFILSPLRRIRLAAGAIASDVLARERGHPAPGGPRKVAEVLRDLRVMRTGDEFDQLAADFDLMAGRVMNYHQQLEAEIARKTEEIQSDLVLAREFQQALLPAHYPVVHSPPGAGGLTLRFAHVYKPTQSVGGDFFHMEKLSDHEAGIFIADVAGHGARAALVTAMLRTLLNDMAPHGREPAALMASINREFASLMPKDGECIFASAFYLVLDIEQAVARFASAGHPSGFLLNRREARATPLLAGEANGVALGLNPEARYVEGSRPLREGDLLILLTDGVLEALSPSGEEYGADRVVACAVHNRGGDESEIINSVLDDVSRHMDTAVALDDLCLVGVGVTRGAEQPDAGSAGQPGGPPVQR